MGEQQKDMTVREVLVEIDRQLSDIKVPMSEIETIGMVIARAISGIRVCVDAMDRADAERAKQEEPAKLEVVPEPAEENKEEPDA